MYFAKDAATLYSYTAINAMNIWTICPTYGEHRVVLHLMLVVSRYDYITVMVDKWNMNVEPWLKDADSIQPKYA